MSMINELVNMFFAGFVFVTIFNWLTSLKMELYLVGIWSLFVNAFIKASFATLHNYLLVEIDFDDNLKIVIYVITAILAAILLAKVYNSNWTRTNLSRLGKKTLGNNMFKDVIDFDKKTILLVYLKDSDYFYSGTFKYMDEHDADSYIALIDYSVFNKADNQLIRDNSGNKMSIVFCLHDIEHIELLYEENSAVWNLLDGSDKRQDVKDNEKVERDKMYLIIQKVMNRLGLVIPAIVFSLFIGALAYLMYYQFIPEVANVIDFIVAMMSVVVLIISYARSKMDERKQYLWVGSTYILLLTIGLIIFMVVAIKIKNVSSIARVLSCICLGITIIQEIIGITKIEHKINIEGEHKQEEKIKRMESESNT